MKAGGRKGVVACAVVVALVGALATAAAASSAADWGKAYCKSQNKFRTALTTADDEITAAASQFATTHDAAPLVTALDAGLSSTKKAASNVVSSLKKVGAADVTNGAQLHKAAIKAYTTVGTQLQAGQDALAKVVPTDTSTFSSLTDASTSIGDAASTFNDFLLGPMYNTVKKNKALALAVGKSCTT
jgi:hypothetical protein